MAINIPTLTTIGLITLGTFAAIPVLAKGFSRRGTGVFYEKNFIIQRAPQVVSMLTVVSIVVSFIAFNQVMNHNPYLTLSAILPWDVSGIITWLGILVLVSGLIFMIGGWYSVGDSFSTDAEILADQKISKDGLLKYVMHPCYSGIVQTLLGMSLVVISPISLIMTLFIVFPLWLNRAKYEEQMLIKGFGQVYIDYAKELKWRRLIPAFFPLGF